MTETMADDEVELGKVRELLRLCRLELAAVREEQERWAEEHATLFHAREQLIALSERLDEALAKQEQTPAGVRSWLRRRLPATAMSPSPREVADVARLRATPLFDGAWYLREYPAVAASGMSPALHYLRRGARNGRNPGPYFDTADYVAKHPDLPRRANPLLHYVASLGLADPGMTTKP